MSEEIAATGDLPGFLDWCRRHELTHLLVAEAWGHLSAKEIERSVDLLDRQLAVLYRLT